MSAHLQFGPEWMRKGRGKTSTAIGAASAGGDAASPLQENVAPLVSSSAAASKSASAGTTGKRLPSLGNLSSGPASVAPSAATPSPGTFSFAAAAQAGSTRDSTQSSTSSSAIQQHSSEGDSARYSKRLLSLYSSERGAKGSASGQDSSSSATVQGSKPTASASGGNEREYRRSASNNVDGNALPRPHTPPSGEARGLNARTVSSALDKAAAPAQRPGLFQRGSNSSSTAVTNASLSPTPLFQSRERDRHGTGIQGGVLSGVAAPLSTRRRKESESGLGLESVRSPRTPLDAENQWDHQRRTTNDAFTSARNRSNRTTTHDSSLADAQSGGAAGGVTTPSVTSNGEVIETWSRLGGRRERAPGEGPIGPPSDHSGGFARFAGYERRRERQAGMPAPRQPSVASEKRERDEGQSSSDVDLSKHATYVLDSLQLDDDDDVERLHRLDEEASSLAPQQQSFQDWSPEKQDWLYRDPTGRVQGPFKANMMQDWYAGNFFDSDLLVRRAEEDTFQPLGEKLLAIGNAVSPFLIPPNAYAQQSFESKAGAKAAEPSSASLPTQQQQQRQQNPSNNSLGWPGNLDILNHYGNGSGHSSPFATPQGHYAELDRHRTQQEQYNEMIRQRQLAEERALYEQRAAQMAAAAMAQAHGRDLSTLGLWGAEPTQGGSDWYSQPQTAFGRDEEMRYYQQQQQLQQQQQQQQQYYDQMGIRGQPAWESQMQAPGYSQEQSTPAAEMGKQSGTVEQDEQQQEETALQQESVVEEAVPVPEEEEAAVEGNEQPILDSEEADAAQQEEPIAAEEEQAPEQAWPQSPTAVEFASESPLGDDLWSKEESPSRGKKSRRAKQKTDEEVKQERAASSRSMSALNSGSIKTMTEDQFRRSQAGIRDSSSGIQAPLSSWLPDASAGATVAAAKSAPWANNTQDATGLSLREIQEAEARQAEARKAARPKLQLNSTSSSDNSALPTTLSWGLASSHSNNSRDAASTPASTATPAWNARQAPKKTLMEIQEEERKRAQKVKESQTLQSEGKSKAYADSASKMQTPSSNGTASSWSVVGASGKPSAPTSVLSRPSKVASPVIQRTASSNVASTPTWNSATSNGPSSKGQTTPRKGGADGANTPSADFLRYIKDQLKGLNVKADDFIEMLLSFPLDPSPDVVDIIAESVYASSSTLDGRRFAADFVAKRKLDANQIKAAKGSVASSGLVNGLSSTSRSLSDVLKTAPASNNDGFGGFKVVKAKGAKKRI